MCFLFSAVLGYRVVALILLMTVSIVAMLFETKPVLFAAVLSAFIWNFFFIPPLFTFHIHNAEDFLMFTLYFVVALVNGVLTIKIRQAETRVRDKEEKEKSIKLYNTLLNSLSHEMRTPLATIIGSVDTLAGNDQTLSTESKKELLGEIEIAALRLNRQVENLLNMSRIETGLMQIKKDWCDVNELIYAVIQKTEASNHKINFNAPENLPLFKLDAGLIEHVIYNLLHNALQYTPAGSQININTSVNADNCVIEISDTGNGFPEGEIENVFQKFYRLPNSKTGGTGLGLSIVKGFTEAHNGKINLKNGVNGGAVFTIEIPAETSYITNLKNE